MYDLNTFQTLVPVEPSAARCSHQTSFLMVGSCFTTEVAERLRNGGFSVLENPFGVLYNPFSVAECVRRCITATPIGKEHLVENQGMWHSWMHHTRFSAPTAEACLEQCNRAIAEAHAFVEKASDLCVILSLGSAYAYHLPDGNVVGNCHKLPPTHFECRRHSPEDCAEALRKALQPLEAKVIFTVSPIRYTAYGLHGNQLSKSALLMAVDDLCRENPDRYHYFPAYEIVLDQLRDYRFFASDLKHPSPLAVEIVYDHFQQTFFSSETIRLAAQNSKTAARERHIPIARQ